MRDDTRVTMVDSPPEARAGSSTVLTVAAMASIGAAVLHLVAASAHGGHEGMARTFAMLATAQAASAIAGFIRPGPATAMGLFVVNATAAVGWLIVRLVGIPAIDGFDVVARPAPADAIAAVLAIVAIATGVSFARGNDHPLPLRSLATSALIVGALLVPGIADAMDDDQVHDDLHDHQTDHDAHGAADEDHHDLASDDTRAGARETPPVPSDDDGASVDAVAIADAEPGAEEQPATTEVSHDDTDSAAEGHTTRLDTSWPRPWDPTRPIDFSGVAGVTAEQQARAEQLAADTLRELPAFGDIDRITALGYQSIGDARTGHEHYINVRLIFDDKFLDPTAPESLVFEVDGDDRTLVSAMFIARETDIDDPMLTEFAGPLMQWHVHDNLCWGLDDDGAPVVVGVTESFGGTCPAGTFHAGGENPMVHVWIAPHPCGPFAALEGHGAGQASVSDGARMDLCHHDHE